MSRPCWLLLALVAVGACAKQPPETAPAREGAVGYRFLLDPASVSELPAGKTLENPRAQSQLTLPVYPASALAGGAGASTVAVRIVIGTEGTVVRVLDCPKLASMPGPFADDFRQAVELAVRSWRFTPGELRTLEPGEDLDGDGEVDYKRLVSSSPIEVFYDVAFEFSVKDGKPGVTAVPP